MHTLVTLVSSAPYIEPPNNPIAILGLLVLAVLIGWGAYRWRGKKQAWKSKEWAILAGLIILGIATNLFLGLRLPSEGALPRPLLPDEPPGPALMFLGALPWILAGCVLGVVPAVVVGAVSGLALALFDTHSLFSMVLTAGPALCYAGLVNQKYRTFFYRMLRHPLVAGLAVTIVYAVLFFSVNLLDTNGPLVARVDYTLTRLNMTVMAMAVEILIGSLVAEGLYVFLPGLFANQGPYVPSPSERSLQIRFFNGTGLLVVLLLLTLMVGDWVIAGQAARRLLEQRLSSTAKIAADSIPFFLESGQNLILQMAGDQRLVSTQRDQLSTVLSDDLRSVPYFRQLYLYDRNGNPITGYPNQDEGKLGISDEERKGIHFALDGVTIQTYTVGPAQGETTAQVSFLANITDEQGNIQGVLLGRSDLASNPFTRPIIQAMEDMRNDNTLGVPSSGVYGTIVDDAGQILYHPTASRLMTKYQGITQDLPYFYDETGPEGTRNLVFFQPTVGRSWAVILTAPAELAQQLALTIALPMLVMILVILAVAVIGLRLGLRVVTASLQTLAGEAARISQGQLNHPLAVKGEDEVGQLGRAFEQMRVSLKARLDELNRLLVVSQGVASTLEFEGAVRPILEAAHTNGASMARVALAADPELD
ncbi:MAG TPA: cache and HAMP domain-containing protein, partial [Anaerolineaceae bacterium]|nr:cache and HAMP domain-containing protein [Anaerolineaceae bacterium]